MVYFIILVCVAAVLGPLLSALPSKHQRAVAGFRDRARQAGIRVQIREPANIPPRLQRATDNPLVCYSKVRQNPRDTGSVELWVRGRSGWESKSGDAVPPWLTVITEHIEVVSAGAEDLQVFWDERGGESAYAQVETVLKEGERGSS
ncbi:MAG: hypothetical protein L7T24_08455 [Luminiphilus sp.]|nr:hypothetical protein [Luminiphilus sp.]